MDRIHEVNSTATGPRYSLRTERRVFTRHGHDRSTKFWPIALATQALPCRSDIIDGEVIVCDDKGASDFNAVGRAIRSESGRLCLVAFDLLYLDGRDLRARPLIERREWLAELVAGNPKIQFSEAFEGNAAAIFRAVEQMGLEGIVSNGPTADIGAGRRKPG